MQHWVLALTSSIRGRLLLALVQNSGSLRLLRFRKHQATISEDSTQHLDFGGYPLDFGGYPTKWQVSSTSNRAINCCLSQWQLLVSHSIVCLSLGLILTNRGGNRLGNL